MTGNAETKTCNHELKMSKAELKTKNPQILRS